MELLHLIDEAITGEVDEDEGPHDTFGDDEEAEPQAAPTESVDVAPPAPSLEEQVLGTAHCLRQQANEVAQAGLG